MLQTVANDATFGPGITFNTDVGFDIAISPDKKAFTALFGGLEAVIDGIHADGRRVPVFRKGEWA